MRTKFAHRSRSGYVGNVFTRLNLCLPKILECQVAPLPLILSKQLKDSRHARTKKVFDDAIEKWADPKFTPKDLQGIFFNPDVCVFSDLKNDNEFSDGIDGFLRYQSTALVKRSCGSSSSRGHCLKPRATPISDHCTSLHSTATRRIFPKSSSAYRTRTCQQCHLTESRATLHRFVTWFGDHRP